MYEYCKICGERMIHLGNMLYQCRKCKIIYDAPEDEWTENNHVDAEGYLYV